jgi:uncharacterized protein YtpQ (UPF0354 family)
MTDQEVQIEEVLELLRRGSHGRDSIALLAAKLIEIRHPDIRIEFASESEIKMMSLGGKSSSIFLQNLWIECERSPEERAEIVDKYVRILVPPWHNKKGLTSENVVVLVRDTEYRNFVKEEDRELITAHLLGDLWVILGVDLPESIEVLTAESTATLGLDKKELTSLGVKNVERMLGEMHFSPYGECFTLGCESIDYASTALLLDYVWEQAAHLIEGDLIVAVPARDTVLFTGSANAKGLQEIKDAAHHVFTTGHHLITETLIRRVDREWKLFS